MILSTNQLKVLEEYWYRREDCQRLLQSRQKEIKSSELKTDKYYNHLKQVKESLDKVESELKGEMKDFLETRYTGEDAFYVDWADVADSLEITTSKAYKLRTKLMKITAKELGWIV